MPKGRSRLDAYVLLTDDDWHHSLLAIGEAFRPRGWLVFKTRDPSRHVWEAWTKEATHRTARLPDGTSVETWTELVEVDEPLFSFRHLFRFHADGSELISNSTLRFRTRDEIVHDLEQCVFDVTGVRDAPDRPGLEFVFVARRTG